MQDSPSFGLQIKRRRRALGLTQDDLARRVGCSRVTIRKLEADERKPSWQVAERLADQLQVAPAERPAFVAAARAERQVNRAPTDGRRSTPGAGPSLRHTSHNLPAQLTPLIGRDRDLQDLRNCVLRDEVRLVTLTGPAGIGKTRLSLEVGAELLDTFADGVFFVALAPIRDPDLVRAAIAHTLEVKGTDDLPLLESLKDAVRDKHMLLVLDNFEQVLAAAPLVVDLLAACPRLKVLVTSRARLHVRGERLFPVPSLALPDLDQLPPVDVLLRYPAVELFVERAQSVKPDFEVTAENAMAVATICARVDGLPLAIELVAARSSLLSPQGLLGRLDRPLALLANGPRDLPERHQTLRDAIDWSYGLLAPQEQTLFARLGVFVGGCTLEAAEAVAGGAWPVVRGTIEGEPAPVPVRGSGWASPILDGVASLLDKSLLQQAESAGEPRFLMLEMIREYALERLEASGEADIIRRRHAACYLALAEAAEPYLTRMEEKLWWRRLALEHDNMRAALQWALDHGQTETALRLGAALQPFWYGRGYLTEGRHWLEQALAMLHPQFPGHMPEESSTWRPQTRVVVAKVLNGAGALAWRQGAYSRARALLQTSLDLQRESEDKAGMASSLNYLGVVAHLQCRYVEATRLYEESLQLRRELGDLQAVATSLNNLGLLALAQKDAGRAHVLLEESLTLNQQLGDRWNSAYVLDSLGWVALQENDFAGAQRFFAASMALVRELGDKRCMVAAIEGLAGAAAGQGQAVRATRLLGAAEALREVTGEPLGPVDYERHECMLAATRDRLDPATFATTWAEGRAMPLEKVIEYALVDHHDDLALTLPLATPRSPLKKD